MSTVLQPPVTVADFERMSDPDDGSKLELVRGEVVVMPPAKGRHGIVCQRIGRFLGNHVDPAKLGWVTTNDTGVVLERGPDTVRGPDVAWILNNFVRPAKLGWVTTNDTGVVLERGPDTVRGPDVAFWSVARQPAMPEGYFEIPPDIAVEVLSPNDRRADVRAKIKEYVFYGVPLVWLVDPETRTVLVYRGSMRGTELDETAALDGGDVLPGFSCKVADLFA